MAGAGVSGLAVFYATAGGVLLWSGFKGQTVKQTITAITSGNAAALNQPGSQTVGSPAISLDSAVTPAAPGSAGGSGSGSAAPPAGTPAADLTGSAAANQALGRLMAAAYGWSTGTEWADLNNVVMSESGWRSDAQNPTSTAYGIFQFLDTTWASVGYTKSSNPATQIAAGLKYIKERYGDPVKAWAFHLANGYY